MACAAVESTGQYGHLNLEEGLPLLSLVNDSLLNTCPQTIIIGGFASVPNSLLTGHTKILWYFCESNNGNVTGNSFC